MNDRPMHYLTHGFYGFLWVLAFCTMALSSSKASALGYSDFPSDLQTILDQRISSLNSGGGICVAGRVLKSDGAPITGGVDVQVNFYNGVDEPLNVYSGGWFIMSRTLGSIYSGSGKKLILRDFGYDPLDVTLDVASGSMTYTNLLTLSKTYPSVLSSLQGVVTDENNSPYYHANVGLGFPYSNHGAYNTPYRNTSTGVDGRYSFSDLSITEHDVCASASGYAYHLVTLTPTTSTLTTQNLKLYPNRRIRIEYVYQADGSRSFTGGTPQSGAIDWLNGSGAALFREGEIVVENGLVIGDLEMYQDQDVLKFRNFYVNGSNGFYDAGAVSLESVTEAAPYSSSLYTISSKPCQIGHVYVVRTYGENCYAKFIVRSNEQSFRTLSPGSLPLLVFNGYNLTLNITSCENYGQLAVRKYYTVPTGVPGTALPYSWEITLTGISGGQLTTTLILSYTPEDVAAAGLNESSLVIYRSEDGGVTWQKIPSSLDLGNHTLQVNGLNSFSLFAIADAPTGAENWSCYE